MMLMSDLSRVWYVTTTPLVGIVFSKTLISVSIRIWLLKLKTVFEQKYPDNRLSVAVTFFFWFTKISNLFLYLLQLTEALSEVLKNRINAEGGY